jgi:AcrR family transcriptional regulator
MPGGPIKRRAARQQETRQQIVDATIELHRTIGAAATTISEIAQERHFLDTTREVA